MKARTGTYHGESESNHRLSPESSTDFDRDESALDEDTVDEARPGKRKRTRLTRSKTSCLKCRARKARCGALPPDSCPYCIKHHLVCVWPAEDRRTLRFMQDVIHTNDSQDGAVPPGSIGTAELVGTSIDDCQPDVALDEATNRNKDDNSNLSEMILGGVDQNGSLMEGDVRSTPERIWDSLVGEATRWESATQGPEASAQSIQQHSGGFEILDQHIQGTIGNTAESDTRHPSNDQSWTNWIVSSVPTSPRSLYPNPELPIDTFDLDMSNNPSMRNFFGGAMNGTDVQVQLLLNGYNSALPSDNPFWPFDMPSNETPNSSRSQEMGRVEGAPAVPGAAGGTKRPAHSGSNGVMHIKYLRSHGRTAYVPGTLAIPIRIQLSRSPSTRNRLESPLETASPDVSTPQTAPDVLRHLVLVFETHLGPLFPCVDCRELELSIEMDAAPSFLMNCVAATSARFSTDPRVTLGSLKPEGYGDVYYERANAMLGSVMRLPLRETVIGFMLLASCADSVTGQWMMAGIATRMAIDLGLHRKDPQAADAETSRQNRLCFWCVLIVDYTVSLGVGRVTSLRPESITQPLPTQQDMPAFRLANVQTGYGLGMGSWTPPRSPFPFAVQMMHTYGPLINILNSEDTTAIVQSNMAGMVRSERVRIMQAYSGMPMDMQWSPLNLRSQNSTGQGAMYFHIHIWVHTILSHSIIPPLEPSHDIPQGLSNLDGKTGVITPIDQLCRSGAKLIGEYLTLCTVVNPGIYQTHPFLGQPLFTAGMVIMKDLQRHLRFSRRAGTKPTSEFDITSSLLTNIASSQIDAIKRAIGESASYWRGTVLVQSALERSMKDITDPNGQEDLGGEFGVGVGEGGPSTGEVVEGGKRNIWGQNDSYAVEVYDWSLPGRYRADGAQVN